MLSIVLLNPNPAPATGVAVTDALPAGVVVATPLVVGTNTCGFTTALVVAGSGSIPLSAGTIPALSGSVAGQCQIQINVVSSTPNTYLNTIPAGAVSSSEGTNLQQAQATLVVSAPINVTGSKAFAPTNVHGLGTASTLTITLTNPNAIPLTNAAITDSLPAAITISSTPNNGTTCGSGIATPSSSAANPATIALSAGTIPANGSCTLFVDVVARNPDALLNANQTNTIVAGALTTTEGATSPAISANIDVQTGASVTKAFAPTPIGPGGTSTLTITVTNLNVTSVTPPPPPLTPITFTDTLPGTITATAVPVSTCGGVIDTVPPQPALPPYTAFTLTGGSLAGVAGPGPGSTTCTITVPVTATATGTNTLPANNYGGVVIAAASGTLAVSPITGSKSFTTPALQTGSTTMTVTLNNLTAATANISSFTDNLLTTMGAGFTVGGPITNTCGSTVTGAVGATLITATGGMILAGSSCTLTIPIAISAVAATGNRTNTIAANGVQTSQGNNTVTITGVVNVQRALTVSKAFAPATIEAGAVSRLTVTMAPTVALTGAGFTDDLTTMGAGFTVAPTPNAVATNCGTGTVTATAGATSFSLAGASLTAGTNCTVAVNIATPATKGTFTNTIQAASIVTTQGVTTSAVTANLVLVTTSVTVNKSFSPTTVPLGTTTLNDPNFSTLSIQIRNNNAGAIALTGVGLTDNLISLQPGLLVADPPTPIFSGAGCTGATITAPIGATQIVLSGASVNANAICTLSVHVVGTISGNLINTVPPGSISDAQGVTNPLQGTATLAVTGSADLTITKDDGVTMVIPGDTTTYTITVSNSGPNDVTGLGVNDTPPAGMTFASWTCASTVGSLCPASGSGPIAASVTVLHGGSVTFTVTAAIADNATGTITNTASLAVPGSVIDTNPVTSASDTDTLTPFADLAITKSDGVVSVTPGGTTSYTITVSNGGPSSADGAVFTDPAVANLSVTSVSCGSASGGAVCPTAPNTTIALMQGSGIVIPTLPALGSVVFTVNATVSSGATGSITNSASIAAPGGVTDPNPGNNSASDTDTVVPFADLAITKTDGVTSVTPGGTTTYTIVVSNNGPVNVVGATVIDNLPAAITSDTFTAVGSGGATGFTASGTGNISDTVNLPNGATITYTLHANIAANATGTLSNTATVSPPVGVTDPNLANNSATDTDTIALTADLAITKTDGVTSVTPGGTTTYTIVVSNNGPSSVTGATVTDVLPAGITSDTFTAVGSGGATGFTASGTGNISDTVNLPNGATITYTLHANIASNATGTLSNTATVSPPVGVTDPNPGNNSATDVDTLTAQVTLVVVKTDGSLSYTPGGIATYTVTVTDTGASDAQNLTVDDILPAGLTLTANVTCIPNGSASCGTVTGANGGTTFGTTGAQLGAGAGNSLVFMVPVAFASDMTADPLVNTATATDVTSGATASGSDSDALAPQVTLAVVKTDGSTMYTPGGTATYTVTITHGGLSDATDITVSDALPAGVTLTANATCVPNGSASCGTVTGLAGQANLGATGAQIAAGAGNSLVFTAPVAFAPAMTTDPLVNTAAATDLVSGATGSGMDSDARSPQVSLAVTKTDGSATYTPGGTAAYTVTVVDNGLTDALNVSVTDALPAGVTLTGAVVCVGNAGATCGTVTGSTGESSFSATGATIAPGGGSSLVFTVPVAYASDLTDNPLVNAATATDLASGASGSASDSDVLAAQAVLTVTKTDGSATYSPGGIATYTIVVTNAGPSDTTSTTVSDPLPSGVTLTANVTCVTAGSANCGNVTGTAGQTTLGTTGASIVAGPGNSLTFTAPVAFASNLTTNPLVNTVTVTDPASASPATATDSDTLSASVDLAITKSANVTMAVPGQTLTYTIVVSNAGPSDAIGATVTDPLPAALSSATWTCVASGGNCTAAGSGSISDTVNIPVGATLTYTVVATIALDATGNLVNTATVGAPPGETDTNPNNTATSTVPLTPQADLAITKTDGVTSVTPGGTTTYTIVVSNNGPVNVVGATVIDNLPAAITSDTFTAVGSGGATGFTASGTGNISDTVNLPNGATITYTLHANIAANATGTLSNTATVSPPVGVTDPNLANNSATDTDTIALTADLAITKTDGVTSVTPGGTTTYTIVVSNNGPSSVTGATVTDVLPAGITSDTFTAVGSGGATGFTASGTGNISDTVNLPNGATITYTLHANIASNATGTLSNTATVSPPVGVTDPNPGNNSATDTDTVTSGATLALVKTAGSATYAPGGTTTYSISVTNSGPSNADSLSVVDNLPAGVRLTALASCVAVGTASCGNLSSAVGGTSFTATGAAIAAGPNNRLVYSLSVQFATNLTAQQITNTATASDPTAVSVASGSATTFLGGQAQPIPTADRRSLLLLTCLILLLAWRRTRSSPLHRDLYH